MHVNDATITLGCYILPILYIYFLGVWPSQQATLGDSSTIPYAVLGDCFDHRARLRSQPRSGTCRLVSMLCSKTVPTTEHVYVPNHARGLVHQSIRRARGLCRPPSTFTFPTMLGDWSTSLYAVLGDCADHRARLHSQLCSRTHQILHALCSELASITLRPQFGDCFSQLHMNRTHIQLRSYLNFLDLATRLILRLLASSGTTSVRCIWRCISVSEILR